MTMIPTVLVGLGGTGAEVLLRVRRLVEETYGRLDRFPIISFLSIDTDGDYKVQDSLAAGSRFEANEQYHAKVEGRRIGDMLSNIRDFSWINEWFPNELERDMQAITSGAGQIRACGRFAFFCNYFEIQDAFQQACDRVTNQRHVRFMHDRYGTELQRGINVFIVGSLSGGTGSGMIVDLGYCIRHWLRREGDSEITAFVPTPNAFRGLDREDLVLKNGYAALMEINYYSDTRTRYVARFSDRQVDEVSSDGPPFDLTYLVGNRNAMGGNFSLSEIREMTAQNIFLDLVSDFSPHKRSIRDNIKKNAMAGIDSTGRTYPRRFISFGLSTVEIPLALVKSSLSYRLSQDLVSWWLNEAVQLPAQVQETCGESLKEMYLTERDLVKNIAFPGEGSYDVEITAWIDGIRNEISSGDLLQSTRQGMNMFGSERGKILSFVGYLQPKVNQYRDEHLREPGADERLHGDFFQRMYENRDRISRQGCEALERELYRLIEDRTRGPRFAREFLINVRIILTNISENFRRKISRVWRPNETNFQYRYDNALASINQLKERYHLRKQVKMEEFCEEALIGLRSVLTATTHRKAHALGLQVVTQILEHLDSLEDRFDRMNRLLIAAREFFKRKANDQADRADALRINGIRLYRRQELNDLYDDFIFRCHGGDAVGSQSRFEQERERLCADIARQVLQDTSPLWQENRSPGESMRLIDIIGIDRMRIPEFHEEIIYRRCAAAIDDAPENARLKNLDACRYLFELFRDEEKIRADIRNALEDKSSPLIELNRATMDRADYRPSSICHVALAGGRNAPETERLRSILDRLNIGDNDIKPLGQRERHRIIFVQEQGGFSLQAVQGFDDLRNYYQDWKVSAIRARQDGSRTPTPVHTTKNPPFWDIFPDDRELELVIKARAWDVLRREVNQANQEDMIRYIRRTPVGNEPVDLAENWDEAIQVLQASRNDRREVTQQVESKIRDAESPEQKQALSAKLREYLENRRAELAPEGGSDNTLYRKESSVVRRVIETYNLP